MRLLSSGFGFLGLRAPFDTAIYSSQNALETRIEHFKENDRSIDYSTTGTISDANQIERTVGINYLAA